MTFKPEIGKRHITRGGEITDIIKLDERSGCLYSGESFSDRNTFWYPTGVLNVVNRHFNDLVAVHEEPQYYWMNVYINGGFFVSPIKEKVLKDAEQRVCKTLKLRVVKDDE